MIGNAPDFLDPDRPDTVRLEVGDAAALGERALSRIGFPADEARIITDQLIDKRLSVLIAQWVGEEKGRLGARLPPLNGQARLVRLRRRQWCGLRLRVELGERLAHRPKFG
jgi:hypothetical protein